MSGCTCETYGHCVVCRAHADHAYNDRRTEPRGEFASKDYAHDACKRGAHSFAEVSSTGWEICEFCGSRRHPNRLAAAQQRKIDGEVKQPRYRVQFSVMVEADNGQHAKNIIPFELRKIPRLEFERTVLTQLIPSK